MLELPRTSLARRRLPSRRMAAGLTFAAAPCPPRPARTRCSSISSRSFARCNVGFQPGTYVTRVLPTGDSIVYGSGSTGPFGGAVGWRYSLQQLASTAGTPIFMVGPLSTGDAIPDPYHDGTPGITAA